ncbi:MFS transporter [Desulfurococcus amylolyticus]|uniref:Major facilitator superfamily MFS_1 n=1 Tax=Desulfurococcus amylolyticus DSM 16532 TaxID=768672 RepID=I3XSP6_DESAM|nr:MFS transporter [Desulfurococcus amylolyticus]AFL66970.1 major facilitator superfamily MFS_1 [Desulfurococcus amylolyticus DSM 16532]
MSLINGFKDLLGVLRGNVLVMAISWFLYGLSGALVQPFFSLYAKSLGAGDFEIALVKSIGMVALGLFTILGGVLTDRVGRVRMILAGTLFVSLVQFAYAFAQSWKQLAIIWVIDEAVHFYQPALTAIVMDSLPSRKELKGFIALNVFPSIPWLFMPVVGGKLYDVYGVQGIRYGFILSGTLSLIVLFLRARSLRETINLRNNRGDFNILNDIAELFRYRMVKYVVLIYLFTGFISPLTSSVWNTYGSIYSVRILGVSNTEWGFINTVGTASSIVASIILASLLSENYLTVIFLAGSLSTISYLLYVAPLLIITNPLLPLVIGTIFGAIGEALVGPLISAILAKILPTEIRGRATGVQRFLENMGVALANYIGGLLYTGLGPFKSILASCILSIIAFVYIYLLFTLALKEYIHS